MITNGSEIEVFVNNEAIGFTTDVSLSINNSLMEVTTKPTNGWRENISAIKGASLNFSGLFETDFSNTNALNDNIRNGSIVEFYFGIETGYQLGGSGYIANLDYDSGTDDIPTFSGSIEVSAEIAFRLSVELQNLRINGSDVTINGVALMVAVQI